MPEDVGLSPLRRLRFTLFGKPIHKSQAHHERLGPLVGLPVFSSDALSSVAYATEAIMSVLILMSVAALGFQIWISLAVVALIAIVGFSYTQTIQEYPKGGGSYIVSSENLGEKPGLVAGAALMIDYILTVAVSIAAGVVAITSAFPQLHTYLVPLSVFFITLVTWANLRGMRESGVLFAIPTYGFILSMATLIVVGVLRSMQAPAAEVVVAQDSLIGSEANFPLAFILLRAFAAGCTALTGIEAVSDGVQAFRAPEPKNATIVLRWMTFILAFLFLGMGYIAMHLPELSLHKTANPEYKTLAFQVATFAFGSPTSPMVYVLQFFTAAILILAANTAFADFPRLSSFIARDGFLPRALARQGDRLVFPNGIILLAISACLLVWYFDGELDQLLPLYAVGVFTAFTLSQTGMVVHWLRKREGSWRFGLGVNGAGMVLCGFVLVVIFVTKFSEGSWLVVVFLAPLFFLFRFIHKRYALDAAQLALPPVPATAVSAPNILGQGNPDESIVLVMVPDVHRGVLEALDYAQNLNGQIRAVHVTIDERQLPLLQVNWLRYGRGMELVVLPSPYRSLLDPVLEYVDRLSADHPEAFITVVVPEAFSPRWYHRILHDNFAVQLRSRLSLRRNVVVANVRYFLA